MTGRCTPDRPWLPALAAAALAACFAAVLLVRADGDPSLLVHAAPPWTDVADGTRGSLTVVDADDGFDGQFFYRLGVDPLSTDETVAGVTFDLPALRNARWGYGALAHVASFGDPDLVPWALLGLNVLAAGAIGAIGGALARGVGRHAGWGVVVALWPGFAYSLSLDTSELVASAFLLGALLVLRHRRYGMAAVGVAAAVVTRDTTTAVAAGLVLGGAWQWWSTRDTPAAVTATDHPSSGPDPETVAADRSRSGAVAAAAVGAAGVAAFAGWQLIQRARFGALPFTESSDNNLTRPFAGLLDQISKVAPPSGGEELFRLACIAGLVGLVGLAAMSWRGSATPLAERVAWLPTVAVLAVLNAYLWSGATAFLRASTEAGVLAIVVILGTPRTAVLRLTAVGLAGWWLVVAGSQVAKLG